MSLDEKTPGTTVHDVDPLNCGPPLETLIADRITPDDQFFVRNHSAIPEVDPSSYRLKLEGLVHRPLFLTLEELRSEFEASSVEATLVGAVNRRSEMIDYRPLPIQKHRWGPEAIGNARWRGVSLCKLLEFAGVKPGAKHVVFSGLDAIEHQGYTFPFAGSIPIAKARSPEVLLAYGMNGKLLPPYHGFPLRLVVPGYVGARSIKWLSQITVCDHPATSHFQRQDYRVYPSNLVPDAIADECGISIGEFSLSAAICTPAAGSNHPAGKVRVAGWAFAGGDRRVARVAVSADGGKSWQDASSDSGGPWRWHLWEIQLALDSGEHELIVRAFDTSLHTMPEQIASQWNFQGYMTSCWHRVTVNVS